MLARQGDRLLELVDQDRRRPAAHIDRPEVIPQLPVEEQLLPERPEIGAAELLLEGHAVEGAVGAEPLAKGDVEVEEPRPRVGRGRHMGRPPLLETHRPGEFAPRLVCNDGIDHGDTLVSKVGKTFTGRSHERREPA